MTDLLRERYEVVEVVGSGGEGRVVKALDHMHDRTVALKIRPADPGAERDHLLSEAQILFGLEPHPNLPVVREDFFEGDEYILAMDWVDGSNLATLLAHRGEPGLPASSVLRYMAQAGEALTHLHTHDPAIVHGDVKPANLVLTHGGRVVLVDFGISSTPESLQRPMGTKGFVAPEVMRGSPRTHASDVYSLAATAFALLTGAPPTGDRPVWTGVEPERVAAFEDAIQIGLSTDPEERPRSAGEFVERLRAGWEEDLPTGALTFCMSDVEDSTPKWDEHPDVMASALVVHDAIVAEVAGRHGGRLVRAMGEGDSTVSVFTNPAEAVRAAADLVRSIENHGWTEQFALRVRIGIDTGPADVRDGSYFGGTLNRAARIRGLADGGQIFLSQITADLVKPSLEPNTTLVDLGRHTLRGIRRPEIVYALAGPGLDAPLSPANSPFRGLLAFGPDDATFFFGRETMVDELVERLSRSSPLTVVGASGSGKSSLVRAGLIPRARESAVTGTTDIALMTPGTSPMKELAALRRSRGAILVVDQFEELFTLCYDEDERERFVEAILDMDGPVVIALRADFYGRCAGFPRLAAAVAANQVLVGPMRPEDLRQAIEGPAHAAGLRLEPGLVDMILRDVADEPGALPLFSHALLATWERRDGRTLTLDAYHDAGGVAGAIASTADRELEDLDPAEQNVARSVFLRLTQLGEGTEDTRRRVQRTELGSGTDVDHVLERLTSARLLTVDADSVEVAHEALIREWPKLRAWLDEDREGLRVHRHLTDATQSWERSGRDVGELYRGGRLAAALEWSAGSVALNTQERDFLEESRRASEAELFEIEQRAQQQARTNRRLRGLLAGAAVLLVLALIAGGVALVQRSNAQQAATRAVVSKLAAQSREVSQTKPDLGLLLAVEANRHQDSVESRGAVFGAVAAHPSLLTQLYGVTSNVSSATFSPDGKLLAVVTNVEAIFYDVVSHKRVGPVLKANGRRWWRASFTPDGRLLAIPNDFGHIELWDVTTRKQAGELRGPEKTALSNIRFSPDGKIGVSGGVDLPHITFFDMHSRRAIGKTVTVAPADSGGVGPVSFSPDGRTIAVPGGLPGITNFWDVRTHKRTGSFLAGDAGISGFQWLPGQRAIVGAGDGTVSLWDLKAKKRLGQVATGGNGLSPPAVSPDDRFVAATTDDGRTFIWEIATAGQFGPVLQADTQTFLDLQWSPDGKLLATAHSRSVALWDMTGRQALGVPIGAPGDTVLGVAFSPDGKILALGHRKGLVVLRDVSTLRKIGELHPKGDTLGIAFSPDGRQMATAGQDKKVQLWDVARRKPSGSLDLVDAWAWDVTFSPDGKLIAVGTDPNSFRDWYLPNREGAALLFDARTHKRVGRAMVPGKGNFMVQGVAFSPDSNLLATGSYYYRTQLWDVATQRKHGRSMDVPDEGIMAIAYSPDGSTVAGAGGSGVERVWDVQTQRPATAPLEGQSNLVSGIAFSPDGRYLADSTISGGIRIWDGHTYAGYGDRELVASDRPVSIEPNFDFPEPLRAAFSPDSRLLATGGIDNRPMLWRIDPSAWPAAACKVAGRNLTHAEWNRYLPGETYRRTCTAFGAGPSA